jgi:hypothetical protein
LKKESIAPLALMPLELLIVFALWLLPLLVGLRLV